MMVKLIVRLIMILNNLIQCVKYFTNFQVVLTLWRLNQSLDTFTSLSIKTEFPIFLADWLIHSQYVWDINTKGKMQY